MAKQSSVVSVHFKVVIRWHILMHVTVVSDSVTYYPTKVLFSGFNRFCLFITLWVLQSYSLYILWFSLFRGLCKSINEIQSKFAMKALSCPWKSQMEWTFFFIARFLLAVLKKIALQKGNDLKLKSLEMGFFLENNFLPN